MYIIGNNKLIVLNDWFDLSDLNNIEIGWNKTDGYQTLIIYDSTVKYLHLIISQIPGNDIAKGVIQVPYEPPHPPTNSGDHQYLFLLYTQSRPVSSGNFNRPNFDLNKFVSNNQLSLIDQDVLIVDSNTKMFYRAPISINALHPLIRYDTNLNEQEQKYCSCLIDSYSHYIKRLDLESDFLQGKDTKSQIHMNPFAVCTAAVGTNNQMCPDNYNFDNFDEDKIIAYLSIFKNKNNPQLRASLLRRI